EPHAFGAFGFAVARLLHFDAGLRRAAATALRHVDELAVRAHALDTRGRLLPRIEHAQRDEPVLAHLDEVTRDAAVVTDELALVGLGFLEVRVMDQRSGDLAARRARPALHRPAVLAEEESVLETD